jgi:hypothetical protein
VGALALLAAVWLSPRVVPYNMDEFVHYHALGCATTTHAQALPSIRDGCGYYDLRLPFTSSPLPLRAYYYIGRGRALPFYPIWRLFDDPVAARLAGAACFLVARSWRDASCPWQRPRSWRRASCSLCGS